TQSPRMEQRVEKECGIRGFRRYTGDTTDRHVGAACAVQKFEVCVNRLTGTRQPNGDPVVHLVKVQGTLEILSTHDLHSVTWMRRNEDFGIDASHLHMSSIRNVNRECSRGSPKRIGIEL